jgi:sugar phosphate isomerase/epimerase
MKISIASYSFHGMLEQGQIDVFGYLESLKYRYHVDAADIWNGMLLSTDETYIRKVREALDEKEMSLTNLCVDWASVWDNESDGRERNYRNALASLRAAELLGAKTVRIDMGGGGQTMSEEQFEFVVKRFREYAEIADARGFRVGPENHFGPALIPDHMVRVAEAVNHPAYGVLLHMGHWDADEDRGDALLAKWAFHTHVDAATTSNRLREGMSTLLDGGYDGYWSVEHHSAVNEFSEVAWQLASIRRELRSLSQERNDTPGPAATVA